MAKGQKKSGREAKKPKAEKKAETSTGTSPFSQPPAAKPKPAKREDA